ncbi:ABC transporter permease [Candidatus Woesearchaeota archaeon]|jgi:putative ABC transport system permease protein|nr:ABC transporter permease [Candidatus Woesearchaeota archaeon]MBT6040965.1 ABC transporter permease [Candidatus Woesearchaeota archaeon]MBT6336145.1 ABC transporter permease [Candidatus Woesearchaeota archaeon]MBT7928090.1 ABC transporter permease [Candidatus Woesearchaeota archaeon]
MKFSKSLKFSINSLLHSQLRSWLTIIGIVIGVAAVISIISISNGMQQDLDNRISSLDLDIITITPGAASATTRMPGMGGGGGGGSGSSTTISDTDADNLTKKDILTLRKIDNIKLVTGTIISKEDVYYQGQLAKLTFTGIEPMEYNEIYTPEISSGRLLGSGDKLAVVIGSNVAKTIFKNEIGINRIINIEGGSLIEPLSKSFRVVGILKTTGSRVDDNILIPIDILREYAENEDSMDSIIVKTDNSEYVNELVKIIETDLLRSRRLTVSEKDFTIVTAQSSVERITDITDSMSLFLGAIAAVSLIVGAVGIANTMFTSVLEKTKEIGIMKSIGATNKDILTIFILNAALFGFVGGVIGVFLGAMVSALIPLMGLSIIGGGSMKAVFTIDLIFYGIALAMVIGTFSGLIPAIRASKLKPIDALRYE